MDCGFGGKIGIAAAGQSIADAYSSSRAMTRTSITMYERRSLVHSPSQHHAPIAEPRANRDWCFQAQEFRFEAHGATFMALLRREAKDSVPRSRPSANHRPRPLQQRRTTGGKPLFGEITCSAKVLVSIHSKFTDRRDPGSSPTCQNYRRNDPKITAQIRDIVASCWDD
jgi:hypothetical protein